jgi:hypothetical protein
MTEAWREPEPDSPRLAAARNWNRYVIVDRFSVFDRILFRRAFHAYLDVVDSCSAAQRAFDVEAVRRELSQQVWAVASGLESLRVPQAQYEELRAGVTSAAGDAAAAEFGKPLTEAHRELKSRVKHLESYAKRVRKSDQKLTEFSALAEMRDSHSWLDAAARTSGEGVAADVAPHIVDAELEIAKGVTRWQLADAKKQGEGPRPLDLKAGTTGPGPVTPAG